VSHARLFAFDDPPRLCPEGQYDRRKDQVMLYQFGVQRDALAAVEDWIVIANLLGVGHEPGLEAPVFFDEFELSIDAIGGGRRHGPGHRD